MQLPKRASGASHEFRLVDDEVLRHVRASVPRKNADPKLRIRTQQILCGVRRQQLSRREFWRPTGRGAKHIGNKIPPLWLVIHVLVVGDPWDHGNPVCRHLKEHRRHSEDALKAGYNLGCLLYGVGFSV